MRLTKTLSRTFIVIFHIVTLGIFLVPHAILHYIFKK